MIPGLWLDNGCEVSRSRKIFSAACQISLVQHVGRKGALCPDPVTDASLGVRCLSVVASGLSRCVRRLPPLCNSRSSSRRQRGRCGQEPISPALLHQLQQLLQPLQPLQPTLGISRSALQTHCAFLAVGLRKSEPDPSHRRRTFFCVFYRRSRVVLLRRGANEHRKCRYGTPAFDTPSVPLECPDRKSVV